MIDMTNLPAQFDIIPDDLTAVQRVRWNAWSNGSIPSPEDMRSEGVAELYERFTAVYQSDAFKDAQRQFYAARRALQAAARNRPGSTSMTQTQLNQATATSLDAYHTGEVRPATEIIRPLFPEATNIKPLMTRPNQKKRLKKALRANESHAAVTAAKRLGVSIRVDADNVSGGLLAFQNSAAVIRQLDSQAKRLAELEARMQEVEKQQAQQAARNAVDDAGEDPREVARRMRNAGESYGAIAKAVGRSRSTIQGWCQ